MQLRHVALLLLLLGASRAAGKVAEGVIALSAQETERYIAKFSFSPHVRSHIEGSFHLKSGQYFDQHPHALVLCLYDEDSWGKFQAAMKKGSLCVDRQRLASWTTDRITPTIQQGSATRDFHFESVLRAPSARAHYWFAVIMDCFLEEYDAHPPPMDFNMTFTNGRSHLPADETGMISINAMALVAMVGYGAFFFGGAFVRMRKLGQVHLITLVFFAAYSLQTLSVLCELLHLRRFSFDGKGLRWRHTYLALDFVSGLSQSISELVLSVLLIALAFGWTLGLESQEPLQGLMGKLLAGLHAPKMLLRKWSHPSTLLLVAIGSSQVVLLAWGRSREDDFNNFHDFEHTPGLVLLAIRLALCALFLMALRRSRAVEKQQEVLAFLERLAFFGAVWFLCLPLLVLIALALPPYRRHQLVAGGSIFVQAVALALLSTLFLEGSHYYKMSSLAHLGHELPSLGSGGGGLGFGLGRKGPKLCVD